MRIAMALSWIALAAVPSAAGADYGLEPGQVFPEIALPSFAGARGEAADERSTIARYRGKKILLHVFASW